MRTYKVTLFIHGAGLRDYIVDADDSVSAGSMAKAQATSDGLFVRRICGAIFYTKG